MHPTSIARILAIVAPMYTLHPLTKASGAVSLTVSTVTGRNFASLRCMACAVAGASWRT
jgi:hypothetical protein